MQLSPKGTYLVSVNKVDKDKSAITIFKTQNLDIVYEYEILRFKKENWPYLKFTDDDSLCFRQLKFNTIEVLSAEKKFNVVDVIELSTNFEFFTIIPKKENVMVVCINNEKIIGYSTTEARIEIYSYPNPDKKPWFSKVIEKAHEIAPIFSPTGKHALFWAQTTHDETGKSYYGEHSLFYLDIINKVWKKVPTYKGPIHDVAWNPNGLEFIVISGFMPAGSVLFDNNCIPKFEFGKHHRNTVKWSPLSRFVCLAGFGNLSGDMEIWDVILQKQLGTCKSNTAVNCSWSPDGRRILTGVLNPRLRVDNGYKVFKYNGVLLNKVDFSKSELYEVVWRPSPVGRYIDRAASPDSDKQAKEVKDDRPRRLFQPKGSGAFAAMLKAEKTTSGFRLLEAHEKFDNEIDSPSLAEEQKEEPKKKKRIRKKKEKGDKGDDDNDGDRIDDNQT